MRNCKEESCNQPIASKESELCHKHHLRLLRHGHTGLSRELVDKNRECIIEKCERKSQTIKGYCLKHYKEWKRRQPVDESIKCSVCDKPVGSGSKGLCVKHYSRLLQRGNTTLDETRKYEPYGNEGRKYYKNSDGKFTHRAVAEQKIGRKLTKGEVVHHIDLDKFNNCEENLLILSNSQHLALHRQLESVAGELVRDEIIIFKDGKYCRNI